MRPHKQQMPWNLEKVKAAPRFAFGSRPFGMTSSRTARQLSRKFDRTVGIAHKEHEMTTKTRTAHVVVVKPRADTDRIAGFAELDAVAAKDVQAFVEKKLDDAVAATQASEWERFDAIHADTAAHIDDGWRRVSHDAAGWANVFEKLKEIAALTVNFATDSDGTNLDWRALNVRIARRFTTPFYEDVDPATGELVRNPNAQYLPNKIKYERNRLAKRGIQNIRYVRLSFQVNDGRYAGANLTQYVLLSQIDQIWTSHTEAQSPKIAATAGMTKLDARLSMEEPEDESPYDPEVAIA